MAMNFAVNYVAVIVAAIAAFVIGFIWYTPLFGKRWMAYLGKSQANMGQPGASFPFVLAAAFVASVVNAWVLALLATNLGGKDVASGVVLGIVVWLGFQATLTAADHLFTQKPWGLWLLNNGHNVIVQAVMGAIVTALR